MQSIGTGLSVCQQANSEALWLAACTHLRPPPSSPQSWLVDRAFALRWVVILFGWLVCACFSLFLFRFRFRYRYVELMTDYLLNKSVAKQFDALKRGFLRVTKGAFVLFVELSSLINLLSTCYVADQCGYRECRLLCDACARAGFFECSFCRVRRRARTAS